MKVTLLLALLLQLSLGLGASPDSATDVAGEPPSTDQCLAECNNFADICLPSSADPDNSFQPHCDGDNDVRQASAPCLLCLKQNGLPKDLDQAILKPPTNLMESDTRQALTTLETNATARGITTVPPTPQEPVTADTPKPPSPSATIQAQSSTTTQAQSSTTTQAPSSTTTQDPSSTISQEVSSTITQAHSSTTRPNCTGPPPSTTDPCRAFCNDYDHICMPPEADPCFTFYPHCDNQLPGYFEASEKCVKCTVVNGVRPNPHEPVSRSTPMVTLPWECWCSCVQTIISEAPVEKCPKDVTNYVFASKGSVMAKEWSCTCGSQLHVSKLEGPAVEGRRENCPSGSIGECTCKRTEKTTKQVKVASCEGFGASHGMCDMNSTSAYEHTTVSNECTCGNCQESDYFGYYSYFEDYFDN